MKNYCNQIFFEDYGETIHLRITQRKNKDGEKIPHCDIRKDRKYLFGFDCENIDPNNPEELKETARQFLKGDLPRFLSG